jgi:hypothetical protein
VDFAALQKSLVAKLGLDVPMVCISLTFRTH